MVVEAARRFVAAHPSDKNKDVARVGHPLMVQYTAANSRSFDSAEVRFAQDDGFWLIRN